MEEELAAGGYKPKENEFDYSGSERVGASTLSNKAYEANALLADTQGNHKKIVELSHFYVDKIGLLKSALRTYVTLTVGDIQLEGGTKRNKKFLEDFIEQVKLNKVIRQSVPDLYKAGDFFWYRETEGKQTVWIHQLNPVDCEVKGHRRDKPVMTLNYSNDAVELPKELENVSGKLYEIPTKKAYQCSLDREGYLRYGKPITTATFEPIQHIQELLDMEKESISSVIESLVIITLGDEKRPATPEQIKKLSNKVKTIKSSSRLVGNHTLKAQAVEKDTSVFNPEKFQVPMKMLMDSIGISPSIFTGEGSYSSGTLSLGNVKKIIEMVRKEIIDTLTDLFKDVTSEAGLNTTNNPKVKLDVLDLTDEKVAHSIARDLYLDGIISAETYTMLHGYSIENEQTKNKEEESKYQIEPRLMSSTLSNKGAGQEQEGDNPADTNSGNPRPSTDST